MTKKQLSILAIMLSITLIAITSNQAFATSVTNYKVTDDTYTRLTFTFREGVEQIYFPVFKMTSDMVTNEQPSFEVQGTVGDYPYLHEAMDEAYKYRQATDAIEYDLKRFVVDVDVVKNGAVQKSLHYFDCQVDNTAVNTLTDNAEGYTTPQKTGFAIIDTIDFTCNGLELRSENVAPNYKPYYQHDVTEYPKTSFKMAENVHSWATFTFNEGIEKIDFPVFQIKGGFSETSSQRPTFLLQGIASPHKLLDHAVVKAKNLFGAPSSVANDDFAVSIDLENDNDVFRTLNYSECRIEGYTLDTQSDSEEGYTGKSGYATTENYTVSCGGLTTENTKTSSTADNPYLMGGRTYAKTTITLQTGEQETLNFPTYKQTFTTGHAISKKSSNKVELFSTLNPSFEIQGVHSNTPILYKVTDLIRTRGFISGSDYQGQNFSVDVNLEHDGTTVVGHHYSDCRVTNYAATTLYNKEEGYVGSNGFAQVGTYDFECKGYQPSNPAYDALFVVEKATNQSTKDLRDTSQWSDSFKYSGKY